jgi:hypothetical protein
LASLEQRLSAGLEAQGWIATASHGPWRRYGKFGRGAMYVFRFDQPEVVKSALWFSELCYTEPDVPVAGPIYDRVLEAGDKQLKDQGVDTVALLVELLDHKPKEL